MPDFLMVPTDRATDRQLLEAILDRLIALETRVSELDQSVANLTAEVADVAVRFDEHTVALTTSLSAAQQTISEMNNAREQAAAEDTAEDAAFLQRIADLQAQLDGQLAAASNAAAQIQSATDHLKTVAPRAETPPVEEPPAEEPPVEEPNPPANPDVPV